MTSINEKLGLKPAGKRSMMKGLPPNKLDAAKITAARCPKCNHTGARLSKTQPGRLYCFTCNHVFDLPTGSTGNVSEIAELSEAQGSQK